MTANNTEQIIKFNKTGFVKITRSDFEFHYGIVQPEKFIIPIKNIKKVGIINKSHNSEIGCNILGMIFNLILMALSFAEAEPEPLIDDNYEEKNVKIEIRYKLNNSLVSKRKEISWIGLTYKKAKKIIGILKMNNKKLV